MLGEETALHSLCLGCTILPSPFHGQAPPRSVGPPQQSLQVPPCAQPVRSESAGITSSGSSSNLHVCAGSQKRTSLHSPLDGHATLQDRT